MGRQGPDVRPPPPWGVGDARGHPALREQEAAALPAFQNVTRMNAERGAGGGMGLSHAGCKGQVARVGGGGEEDGN